jgi:hypothetical protein
MILHDFVMLGKTIPEPSSDGRIFVCSAGFSNDLRSLIRVYPLARLDAPRRWSINEVALERNPQDSRRESFRLRGDRSRENHLFVNQLFNSVGKLAREHRMANLDPFRPESNSIKELNEQRRSLGIIEPIAVPALDFEFRENAPDSPQLSLFATSEHERESAGAKRFAFQPYLGFHDGDGWHRLQLRDWGVYEFMRKHGNERRHELADACCLSSRPCLLVGNMNHRRRAWLVISVLHPIEQLAMAV